MKSFKEIHHKYLDGKLQQISHNPHLTEWQLIFTPCTSPNLNLKEKNIIFTFHQCFSVKIDSLNHQLNDIPQKSLDIISWGEDPQKPLLKDLKRKEVSPIGNYQTLKKIEREIHEFFFEGFEVNITILCRKVSIKYQV